MMRLTDTSGVQHIEVPDDPMDLDEPTESRHTETADQVVVDAMDLCERVVQPYDDRGFFLNLPEVCLIHLMTYLVVPSLKNLSETSKESCQKLKAIFMPKDQWINNLTPLSIGKRFILESLERSQKELEERFQIFDQARIFTNDIMDAEPMSRGEIREGLSYGLFEGSLYQFSRHLLSLKRAYEEYNETAVLSIKQLFDLYVQDRQSILKAVHRGTATSTDFFFLRGLVTPPEISQMRSFTELSCYFGDCASFVPNEIYTFSQLTSLVLQMKFQSISADIQNLTQLRYLDLHSSNLESLPPEIGELVHLRQFHLAGCENLKSLPESIVRLKLNVLNLIASGIVEGYLSGAVQKWMRQIPTVHTVAAGAEPRGSCHPRELV